MGKKKIEYTQGRDVRPTLIEIHISDLHFGAFDPKTQYSILEEQFLSKINKIRFNILSINGDIFDHKCMSNSDMAMYATMFVDQCVQLCSINNATMVIILGTAEHDADQLKLFYHYLQDPFIDMRIVEQPRFEYIQGAKVLCIPEKYGLDESIYSDLLFNGGVYDEVYMHGTYKGSVYGNNVGNSRLFQREDFIYCSGPVISGHVHTPGCFDGFVYYSGCPYRWSHGQEEEKGFLIVIHDLEKQVYYTHMEFIKSFRYITINLDNIIEDPKDTIAYINQIKEEMNIDYIRVKINNPVTQDDTAILKNYYRTNPNVKLEFEYNTKLEKAKENVSDMREIEEYGYILDKEMSPYEILRRYINQQECQDIFLTSDALKKEIEDILL